jgi:hypothetical protein
MSILSTPAAATTARSAAARAGARLLAAKRAGILTEAILLLLTLRLQRKRSEHDDALSFLQPAEHFGVVEIALAELHDARMEAGLCAIAREDETRARARWARAHLRRRRECTGASTWRRALTCRASDTGRGRLPGVRALCASRASTRGAGVDAELSIDGTKLLVDRLHFRAAAEPAALLSAALRATGLLAGLTTASRSEPATTAPLRAITTASAVRAAG